MSLTGGTRLGVYEVGGLLGAGGSASARGDVLCPRATARPRRSPDEDAKLEAMPMLQSAAEKVGAEISPDGRWMACQSDESGQAQG